MTRTRHPEPERLKPAEWKERAAEWDDKEAAANGVDADDLIRIWSLLANSSTAADTFVSKLILTMIPKEQKVSRNIVRKMIVHLSQFKPKSKVTALKYLTGLLDYNLCDKETFSEYDVYCRIFFAGRSNEIIPWICALLKRISTPELVSKSFVNDMIDLASKPTIPVPVLKAVIELLRVFKSLKPKLIPQNILSIPIGASKKLVVDESLRTALFTARKRVLGVDDSPEPEETLSLGKERNTAQAQVEFEKVQKFLHKLNETCFPEFRLHRCGDPDPDDYIAILKMSKYNQMRCALKTTESLPFIVNDQGVYDCFNNFMALILQHKFDSFAPEDEPRHRFILRRAWEVTVIDRKGIPAVTDWLLRFMRTWDGHLFKREIFQLLEWLPPIQFTDGYLHILQKLETLFLYGAAEDRMRVWSTLKKLAIDWMLDLQSAIEDNNPTVLGSIKDAVGYLLQFIDSLVGQLSYDAGHKDFNFLIHCCDTYIELNNSMALIKNQPFYVFPPVHLWVMVVLSNSLAVMDSFCCLLCKATPRRSLPHLKHTDQQLKMQTWNGDILNDVFRFFMSPDSTDNPIFPSIFVNELDALEAYSTSELELSCASGTELADICKSKLHDLLNDLNTFSAMTSDALTPILLEPRDRGQDFMSSLDKVKAEAVAPNVLQMVKWFGNQMSVLQSENGSSKS